MLASSVELDAFARVKKAVDDLVAILRTQQADEVKKHDYCQRTLHENELETTKAEDGKTDLEAKEGELENAVSTLHKEIGEAKVAIEQAQVDLQRASTDRQTGDLNFQRTIADQTMTIEVLHKATDRLSAFYHDSALLQSGRSARGSAQRGSAQDAGKQTPPAQGEYEPNAGAGGVLSMIEKLISDARAVLADARLSEAQAQDAYEGLALDTNGAVDALSRQVSDKSAAIAKEEKRLLIAQSDFQDAVKDIEGLAGYSADAHRECDALVGTFATRQEARGEEIHSLQQAMSILNGADLDPN